MRTYIFISIYIVLCIYIKLHLIIYKGLHSYMMRINISYTYLSSKKKNLQIIIIFWINLFSI